MYRAAGRSPKTHHIREIHSVTQKLWCHRHVSASTSPHSFLPTLDVTKRCNTSCSSHSIYQHKCAGSFGVPPAAFCFMWLFVMYISASSLTSPRPPPNIPGRAEPLQLWSAAVTLRWSCYESALCVSHHVRGHRNPGALGEAGNHEQQPCSGWIMCLWLAGSHAATTAGFPNDSGF